ncbi:MAG: hypothetical protein HY321_15205 [Armatimonadetes bacterium]|nr:hypothetical protein [Armatimonadota bacterium]
MNPLTLSWFSDTGATTPDPQVLAWKQLVAGFSAHERRPERGGRLFSPVAYLPGTKRGNAGVAAIYAAVLDVDDGAALEDLRHRWEGLAVCWYSTYHHMRPKADKPAAPRWRLVLPLAEPFRLASGVDQERWKAVYQSINRKLLDGQGDHTSDAARMFWPPICPADGPAPFAGSRDGEPLKWQEYEPAVPALAPLGKPVFRQEPGSNGRPTPNRLLADAMLRTGAGTGDNTGIWLACQLRDNEIPEGEALPCLREYAVRATVDPSHPFGDGDAARWWRSAHTRPAREPWAEPAHTHAEDEFDAPELSKAAPAGVTPEPIPLAECLAAFQERLHMPDTGAVEVALGAIAANYSAGDPVWLLIVGPPGGGKTEVLNAVLELRNVIPVAVLTEGALLSGTPRKDKAAGATGGLLRQVGQFGILCLKDFGSVLTVKADTRGPILAALREVYDGRWTRYVGTDGGRPLPWAGKCGLIGGATTSIDGHHAVMSALGERFAFFRLPSDDREELGQAALERAGQEQDLRRALSEAVRRLFAGLTMPIPRAELSREEQTSLVALASFVTRARSAVERDTHSSRREVLLVPEPELPTRFVKVLACLFSGLVGIGCQRPRAWGLVRKVALDSMPRMRSLTLDYLLQARTAVATKDLAVALDLPTSTLRLTLEDLTLLGVLSRNDDEQEDGEEFFEPRRGRPADTWSPTAWARETFARAEYNHKTPIRDISPAPDPHSSIDNDISSVSISCFYSDDRERGEL